MESSLSHVTSDLISFISGLLTALIVFFIIIKLIARKKDGYSIEEKISILSSILGIVIALASVAYTREAAQLVEVNFADIWGGIKKLVTSSEFAIAIGVGSLILSISTMASFIIEKRNSRKDKDL